MTTTADAEQPIAGETDASVVAGDLPCPCGYNLRGLARDGRCPECGGDVAAAIRLQRNPFASDAGLRRMMLGAIIMLLAHVAWTAVLVWRSFVEGGDGTAYVLAGISGPKAFMLPAAYASARAHSAVVNQLIPLSHAVYLVGLWSLTTSQVGGRAASQKVRRLGARWVGLLAFAGVAGAYLLWGRQYVYVLGFASIADAAAGLWLGVYLAGVARLLGARWLRAGGWVVAVVTLLAGATFASAFLLMWPGNRYWEPVLWTSLATWTWAGLTCWILLAFTWLLLRRVRRDLVGGN